MRVALLAVLAIVACGGGKDTAAPARATSAETLIAPWLAVRFGDAIDTVRATRPGLEPSGYGWIDTSDPNAVVEIETDAEHVRTVRLEWRGAAADAAERDLRARLPAPRECATLHESVEDFKTLLWKLPDGASASAMRKGKTWRLTVARPPAEGFQSLFESCGR